MANSRKRKYAPGEPFRSIQEAVEHALAGNWFWFGRMPPLGHPLHWSVVMNWSIATVRGMVANATIRKAEKIERGEDVRQRRSDRSRIVPF